MTARHERPAARSKSDAGRAAKKARSLTHDSFVRLAANAVVYELEAADLALARARRQEIKGFAREVLADFEKIGHELKSALGSAEELHSPPENLDASFQSLLDELYGASDAEFDARYLAQVRSTHSAAITLFNSYRQSAGDGGLANLCGIELSVLEHHLEIADQLSRRL